MVLYETLGKTVSGSAGFLQRYSGKSRTTARGVAPNELTVSEDRDWLAGTPWHEYVAARVEAIAG